jgi:hypothetical protein
MKSAPVGKKKFQVFRQCLDRAVDEDEVTEHCTLEKLEGHPEVISLTKCYCTGYKCNNETVDVKTGEIAGRVIKVVERTTTTAAPVEKNGVTKE